MIVVFLFSVSVPVSRRPEDGGEVNFCTNLIIRQNSCQLIGKFPHSRPVWLFVLMMISGDGSFHPTGSHGGVCRSSLRPPSSGGCSVRAWHHSYHSHCNALPPRQRVLHVGLLSGGRPSSHWVQDPGGEMFHRPGHEGWEEQEDGVPHQHHHHPQQSGDDGIQSCHQWSFLWLVVRNIFPQGVYLDSSQVLKWYGSSLKKDRERHRESNLPSLDCSDCFLVSAIGDRKSSKLP